MTLLKLENVTASYGSSQAIIVIDKSLAEFRQVCDRATIIERGKTAWSGSMADLTPVTTDQLIGV